MGPYRTDEQGNFAMYVDEVKKPNGKKLQRLKTSLEIEQKETIEKSLITYIPHDSIKSFDLTIERLK